MKIYLVDPINDTRWDEFVDSQKHATIFHTSAWARVVKDAYGYSPRYYVFEGDEGRLQAALPFYQVKSMFTGNRLVCLPFSDMCWPLGDENGIELLLNKIKGQIDAKLASYLEIRGWQNGMTNALQNLAVRNYHLLYILDLEPGTGVLKKNFHDSVRRGIRQAEKRGVTVRIGHEQADLELFYKLHVGTRKKLGVLPQPRVFFKALYKHVISKQHGFIGLAESEGKVIAGVVFLTYKDTMYYKFNASDENHLQKRPNHLVTWEAIKYACANKFKFFDLGRCSPDETGLRIFKERWGTKEFSLPYYYYPEIKGITSVPEGSLRYRVVRKLLHNMPSLTFEIAGSVLYKHFG